MLLDAYPDAGAKRIVPPIMYDAECPHCSTTETIKILRTLTIVVCHACGQAFRIKQEKIYVIEAVGRTKNEVIE